MIAFNENCLRQLKHKRIELQIEIKQAFFIIFLLFSVFEELFYFEPDFVDGQFLVAMVDMTLFKLLSCCQEGGFSCLVN
jgi:fucose 4-O-acetylase-like acetyltransferase